MNEKENIEEKIIRFLDDEMTEGERTSFISMMEADPSLRKKVEEYRQLSEALGDVKMESDLRSRMKDLHADVDYSAGTGRPGRVITWFGIAAVFLALIGIGVVWKMVDHTGEPPIAEHAEVKEEKTEEGEVENSAGAKDAVIEEAIGGGLQFEPDLEYGVVVGSNAVLVTLDNRRMYTVAVNDVGDSSSLSRIGAGRSQAFYGTEGFDSGLSIASEIRDEQYFTFSIVNGERIEIEVDTTTFMSSTIKFTVDGSLVAARGMAVINSKGEVVGLVSDSDEEGLYVRSIIGIRQNAGILGTPEVATVDPEEWRGYILKIVE